MVFQYDRNILLDYYIILSILNHHQKRIKNFTTTLLLIFILNQLLHCTPHFGEKQKIEQEFYHFGIHFLFLIIPKMPFRFINPSCVSN